MILKTRTEKILYSALEMKCDPQNAWMPLDLAVRFAESHHPKLRNHEFISVGWKTVEVKSGPHPEDL